MRELQVLVEVYWKGEYYHFRRDDHGYVFTYDKAKDKLIEINTHTKGAVLTPRITGHTNSGKKVRKHDGKMA